MSVSEERKTYITYYGHAMFEIKTTSGTAIITDPYNERIKPVLPDVAADLVLVSHGHFDHDNISLVKGNPQVIRNAGSFNFRDVSGEGIVSYHDTKKGALRGQNHIFRFTADGIVFAHLGDLGHSLDQSYAGKLSGTDVLMVPVGGTYTLNFQEAYETAKKIQPKIVIPMHYKETDSMLDVDSVEPFLSKWYSIKKKGHSSLISKEELGSINDIEVWVFDSK